MARLAPMNQAAVSLMAEGGTEPRDIATALGLSYEAVAGYLDILGSGAVKTLVWDLETTSFKSDIGTLLVASFYDPDTHNMETFSISTDSDLSVRDREALLLEEARAAYIGADILIGFNSLAFDRNWLQGVSARHGYEPLPRRFHIDCYQVARYGMRGHLQSNSLANLGDFFGVGEKDHPSKHEWREAALLDPEAMAQIVDRCESDVLLTARVWARLKPYWFSWRGQ